jgi:hypothetical protein
MGAQGMNRGQDVFLEKINRRTKIIKRDISSIPSEYLYPNTINPS